MIGWNNIGLNTWWTTIGLSVFFCLYQGAASLHAQEQTASGEYRATIGMRMPEIYTLDPRAFPFDKQARQGISYLGPRQPP